MCTDIVNRSFDIICSHFTVTTCIQIYLSASDATSVQETVMIAVLITRVGERVNHVAERISQNIT